MQSKAFVTNSPLNPLSTIPCRRLVIKLCSGWFHPEEAVTEEEAAPRLVHSDSTLQAAGYFPLSTTPSYGLRPVLAREKHNSLSGLRDDILSKRAYSFSQLHERIDPIETRLRPS